MDAMTPETVPRPTEPRETPAQEPGGSGGHRDDPPAQRAPRVARKLGRGYSRFVGAMKVLLPVGALAVIGLVVAWPYLDASDDGFRLGFSSLVLNEAENPNIVNPRLVGTDSNGNPFTLTADMAKNFRLKKDDEDFWQSDSPVELEMPKADLTLEDGSWLVLTADSGLLTPSDKSLDLFGNVTLFHDLGYELRTEKATIDLEAGAALSDTPVDGQGPFGTLRGEGMQLTDKGRNILFTGKARVLIYPNAGKGPDAGKGTE